MLLKLHLKMKFMIMERSNKVQMDHVNSNSKIQEKSH